MDSRRTTVASAAALASEGGHAAPAIMSLGGAAGAVLLGIGAASDARALAIAGGVILAAGLVLTVLLNHVTVEWGLMGRLDRLEK